MRVPRKVRKAPAPGQAVSGDPVELETFRDYPAWILLGEPGAGKTEALRKEAEVTGGVLRSVGEFIIGEPPSEWHGKTLFLDGLDEVRAGAGNDTTLRQVRAQLKRLGNPPFRISCRAADWYGTTDTEDLSGRVSESDLQILLLEPLTPEEILRILRENLEVADPEAFVAQAERAGIDETLDNPQMLNMLVAATGRGNTWPTSRNDIFLLACERLAREHRKRHRDKSRSHSFSTEALLDAAGQVNAVTLFSNLAGIALDVDSSSERYACLSDIVPPDQAAAAAALGSKLFRANAQEQLFPAHRSIAEYLAARWLARCIDKDGLPLGRVLNLLVGRESHAVAGLRGVYAWLAFHSKAARATLIKSDPFTCAVYGDVKHMPAGDKRALTKSLLEKARSALFQRDFDTAERLGALADGELVQDLLDVLREPDRSDAAQSRAVLALDIILHGHPLPQLLPALLDIVRDESRWPDVRRDALRAWLKLNNSSASKLSLLNDIVDNRLPDPDDELTGILLEHLYGQETPLTSLIQFLHTPKAPNTIGSYVRFWSYDLPRTIRPQDLPATLDYLAKAPELTRQDAYETRVNAMADTLLVKGVEMYGDSISNERLISWLGIGTDEYGTIRREEKQRIAIATWLEQRPDRYKQLLALLYTQYERKASHPPIYRVEALLHEARVPADLGRWHLDQATLATNESRAREHISQALSFLIQSQGGAGLSLDDIVCWGEAPAQTGASDDRKQWLSKLLQFELSSSFVQRTESRRKRAEERKASRHARTKYIAPMLADIRSGTARAQVMHELASVWMNRYSNIVGDTVQARFECFSENGLELLDAARSGFIHCLGRSDLPKVEDIIDLHIKNREHLVRLACLVGMDLLWQEGATKLAVISEDNLRRVIAFRFTGGDSRDPAWFKHLLATSPALVADVLVAYASATLRAGMSFVSGLYALNNDPEYAAVAELATTRLLELFPTRATTDQLRHLEHLLKASLRYTPSALGSLVRTKLARKGMDVAQRVYWRTAAMLLDPVKYEAPLWKYVGTSEARIKHLAEFLSERYNAIGRTIDLSAASAAKLIELLASHAEVEWRTDGTGAVTGAMLRGDQVRALITYLGAMASADAADQIERLLANPKLVKLKWLLEQTKYGLQQRRRENEFRFLPATQVAQVFANSSPINTGDLAALVVDHLDQIATDIRNRDDDPYRHYWTETQPNKPKTEAAGRDLLLTFLKERLNRFGIDCEAEGNHTADKRADIVLSYGARLRLPIEIKRESNSGLWSSLRGQLIKQYTIDAHADGYGIYIVLWYGGTEVPASADGGKKPRSANELRARLEALLNPSERQKVFIRVVDVTYPA